MAAADITDLRITSESVALARAMGLRRAENIGALDLVERIERGLPLTSVDRIAKRLDPDDRMLKYRIVPKSTYARLKAEKKPLSRDQSEKVHALARVATETLKLWNGDDAAAMRFLNRPHPLLDGRTPFEVANETTTGAELIVQLLGKARAGVAI